MYRREGERKVYRREGGRGRCIGGRGERKVYRREGERKVYRREGGEEGV